MANMQLPEYFLESISWHEHSEEGYLTNPQSLPVGLDIGRLDDPHVDHFREEPFHFYFWKWLRC